VIKIISLTMGEYAMSLPDKYLNILKSKANISDSALKYLPNIFSDDRQRSVIELARQGSQSAFDAVLEFARQYWEREDFKYFSHLNDYKSYHPTAACLRVFDKGSAFENIEQYNKFLQRFLSEPFDRCLFADDSFVFTASQHVVLENLAFVLTPTYQEKILSANTFELLGSSLTPSGIELISRQFIERTAGKTLFNFLGTSSRWQLPESDNAAENPLMVMFPKAYDYKGYQIETNFRVSLSDLGVTHVRETINEASWLWDSLSDSASKIQTTGLAYLEEMAPFGLHLVGRLCAIAEVAMHVIDEVEKCIDEPESLKVGRYSGLRRGLPILPDQLEEKFEDIIYRISSVSGSLRYLANEKPVLDSYIEFHKRRWLTDPNGYVRSSEIENLTNAYHTQL